MLIQPTKPFEVFIKIGTDQYPCQMLSLDDDCLELNGEDYIDHLAEIEFRSSHFRGVGIVKEVSFEDQHFNYLIAIQSIHFQPGFLINTEL